MHTPPQVQAPEPARTRASMPHERARRRGGRGVARDAKGDRAAAVLDGSWTGRVRRGICLAQCSDTHSPGTARASGDPRLSRHSLFGRSLRPAHLDRTPAQGPRPRDWGGFTQGGAVAGGTGQARVSPRRNLAPPHYIGVVGCAERAHSQGPGEPRVRHPKGRTTTRAGRRESGRDARHEQRHPGGPGSPARPDPARVWAQM